MTWLNNNGRHASFCKIEPFHTIYNMTTFSNNFTYYFITIRFGDNILVFVGMGSIMICIKEKITCSQICHNNHPLFTWSTIVLDKQQPKIVVVTNMLLTPWRIEMWIANWKQQKSKELGPLLGSQHYRGVKGCVRALGCD
jgi:hypothetical protein